MTTSSADHDTAPIRRAGRRGESRLVGDVVRTYCSLCGVGCPSAVAIDGDRVAALEPDLEHPQGGAICAKGRAAPEIHDHPHRLNRPLIRTRPKSDPEPGWREATWDEALGLIAARLLEIRAVSGPEAVAFGRGTGSGTGLSPTEPWVKRLAGAFGSPNYMTNTHLCNWARDGAAHYTFGVYPLPMPDVDRSGCIVLWGSNPSATLLNLATGVVAARRRGARLVVVDPRRIGLANKADVVLQVRPGTDAALALAFIHLLIEGRRYDLEFVRDWTNGPLLVRDDTGRLLRAGDVAVAADPTADAGPRRPSPLPDGFVALDASSGELAVLDPRTGTYDRPTERLAIRGRVDARLARGGSVPCRTVVERLAETAALCEPETAARITGVAASDIRAALDLMTGNRPVSHHTWNGIVQHTNATQAGRAIEVLYALLGDWDRPGGNVMPSRPRTSDIGAPGALSPEQAGRRLGRDDRPLGPPVAPPGNIAAYDLYTAILEGRPYQVRGLLSFGGNTIMNTGDPQRGRAALERLEFFAQAELYHTPTNAFADVVLPAASFLESEMFIVTGAGMAQRRRRSVAPRYERRPDVEIIFDLAVRLGLGDRFAGGDVGAAYDEVLAPAGLTWAGLLDRPHGIPVAPPIRHRKYAEPAESGGPVGFATPTRKVELFVDAFAEHGQPALPEYHEPLESPVRTPELARDYPLVLTNAKRPQYLHSQGRGIASLRRSHPNPTLEIHPETAAVHGIEDGAWVIIETPRGQSRAQADVTVAIAPGVVCTSHGWWEAAEEIGLPAIDPYDRRGSNVNLLVHNDARDPISGGIPHRSSLCRVRPVRPDDGPTLAAAVSPATTPGAPR